MGKVCETSVEKRSFNLKLRCDKKSERAITTTLQISRSCVQQAL